MPSLHFSINFAAQTFAHIIDSSIILCAINLFNYPKTRTLPHLVSFWFEFENLERRAIHGWSEPYTRWRSSNDFNWSSQKRFQRAISINICWTLLFRLVLNVRLLHKMRNFVFFRPKWSLRPPPRQPVFPRSKSKCHLTKPRGASENQSWEIYWSTSSPRLII